VVPLDRTVAVFNIDAMGVYGRSRDYTVVGMGNSELEDMLKAVADKQGRTLHEEAHPEAGGYFRSDHFNFAKAGVPALYVDAGDDLVEGGKEAGEAAARDYNDNRYHSPADEYDAATWKLDGTVEDLVALYTIGHDLANSDQWPNWYEGNPFKARRDEALAK
jgi:Zn-dependent M28 family amino/carboxypeptidase